MERSILKRREKRWVQYNNIFMYVTHKIILLYIEVDLRGYRYDAKPSYEFHQYQLNGFGIALQPLNKKSLQNCFISI